MNIIELDGKKIKLLSHEYLIEMLDLPSYYGRNLDALYDCLTEIGVETEIHLINSKDISLDLYDTFFDAACESDFLTFSSD
ncbi:barstar family protein [Methanosphaera sp. WGK6]|uniref:barstar family protein n=1 Tax=Methanosphaera sp. WGK6 TaxID=1561964 RepID=UPI00084C3986|nr:barstar family protein [Methanosphaera sp. WGK6]